nr:MAG TPA: hypothetical protein [Caudoviricetes sp.]DAY00956.1 MAG TPA: hypothetical protein [Caudoviricetes sp.]
MILRQIDDSVCFFICFLNLSREYIISIKKK